MEKNFYSLRTNIGYFLNKPIGFSQDFHLAYPEIFLNPDLNVHNLASDYRLSRTREGVLLQAQLQGEIEVQCTRCLSDMFSPVRTDFEELFVFESRSQDDSDEIFPEDGYIDLAETFRDYLLLEVPINHLCRSDCKGICVECGQNLNEADCGHGQHIQFD